VTFHRCRVCGCVSHRAPNNPQRTTVGVNARLMLPKVIASVRIRHKDGSGSGKYTD
jgi:hypothetical protein